MAGLDWHVADEWADLRCVVVGIGEGLGGPPSLESTYDPKTREHVLAGTFPDEREVAAELDGLAHLLQTHGVEVLRPESLGFDQVFARDIALVIDGTFIIARMVENRQAEQEALGSLLGDAAARAVLPPEEVRIEGGDVLVLEDELWVGTAAPEDAACITTRTNAAAVSWLASQFPHRRVRSFDLIKSATDPLRNVLHLDCCLTPLGLGHALLCPEGFVHTADVEFVKEKYAGRFAEVTVEEMASMQCNLFSISPSVVVSEERFHRVNAQLTAWGYTVLTVPYRETAKMGGLLRCTTLPVRRGR
jgi:N-dimethylarginine dimethylaminohydrolase